VSVTKEMTVRVANAPCNFGIYSLEAPVIGPDELLSELAAAGYTGIDSGPIGFLGTGAELVDRLDRHGMHLAGGWVDLRFTDPDGYAEDLAGLDAALDVFTAVRPDDPRFAPRPTLALPADPHRFARPGEPIDPALAMPAGAWPGFAERVQQAADRCRDRGLEPVFHYHLGTQVETGDEADRLLELTDISVCLDTGHLRLAGGDPVAAVHRWGERIRQVHIKDAAPEIHARVRASGGDFAAVVAEGGFCAVGQGDVDVAGVLRALGEIGYAGWLVVEQDAPVSDTGALRQAYGRASGQDVARILADQRANRASLAELGL
jgi:inosose dehydratase